MRLFESEEAEQQFHADCAFRAKQTRANRVQCMHCEKWMDAGERIEWLAQRQAMWAFRRNGGLTRVYRGGEARCVLCSDCFAVVVKHCAESRWRDERLGVRDDSQCLVCKRPFGRPSTN